MLILKITLLFSLGINENLKRSKIKMLKVIVCSIFQIFGVIFVLTAIVIVTLENPIMNRINRCFEACNNKTFTVVADAEEKC